jgi:hypothetical protein
MEIVLLEGIQWADDNRDPWDLCTDKAVGRACGHRDATSCVLESLQFFLLARTDPERYGHLAKPPSDPAERSGAPSTPSVLRAKRLDEGVMFYFDGDIPADGVTNERMVAAFAELERCENDSVRADIAILEAELAGIDDAILDAQRELRVEEWMQLMRRRDLLPGLINELRRSVENGAKA